MGSSRVPPVPPGPLRFPREAQGRRVTIFTALDSTTIDTYESGAMPGHGTFACTDCGTQLSPEGSDTLTDCPRCGNASFRRDSMFEEMQEHEAPSTSEFAAPTPLGSPEGLRQARAKLPGPGKYLVCCEGKEETEAFRIEPGWTRIGRSVNADIRLDDPSVSRRHALIVCEDPDAMRVLDDRSLNGIYLNGELVEWGRLKDGDELTVGRFRLFALEAA